VFEDLGQGRGAFATIYAVFASTRLACDQLDAKALTGSNQTIALPQAVMLYAGGSGTLRIIRQKGQSMNIPRTFACTLALVLPSLSASATDAGSQMASKPGGTCTIASGAVRQTIKLVFDNVRNASKASLDEMVHHVAPDVVFMDPTASTRGREAFRKVYDPFITTDAITYKITDWSCSNRTIYMDWIFGTKGKVTNDAYVEWEGVSKFVLNKDGLIAEEVDNWSTIPPAFLPLLRK
jgi:ketosteroid isomerase-like protein